MTKSQAERQTDIERLCHAALDRPSGERASFLRESCGDDEALREEVESILAHAGAAEGFLEAPIGGAGGQQAADRAQPTPFRGVAGFEVKSLIGAGGMGEVYLARDLRLERDVALKVPRLPTPSPISLAQVEREARLLAAVNHPNIAAIHGIEASADGPVLVLELVDGETLAAYLARRRGRDRGLPLADALSIARQIAEALAAAHDRGIVHRDLKTGNVMLTREGVVKVLDFGVARALTGQAEAPSRGPDAPAPVVFGTPAYMSPEQARGESVDRRSDLWAFGCVLFEMLTGHPSFARDSIPETLAAVTAAEPEWERLPADTPEAIRRLLRRCLRKDRVERLADAWDARLEIVEAKEDERESAAAGRRWPRGAVVVVAVAVLAAALTLTAPGRDSAAPDRPVRFTVAVPQSRVFGNEQVALSPDGARLAFAAPGARGEDIVWLRTLDSLEATPLAGTEGAYAPFWSPDGSSIAFFANGKLRRLRLDSGTLQTVCDVLSPAIGVAGAWGPGDVIVFARTFGPLHRVPASGGEPTIVQPLDERRREFGHYNPMFFPDGRHVAFRAGAGATQELLVSALDGGPPVRLAANLTPVAVTRGGSLVFIEDGVLKARRLNLRTVSWQGPETVIADTVASATLSSTGALAYRRIGVARRQLLWFDRRGVALGPLGPVDAYDSPALSPDGRSVAVGKSGAVWIIDVERGTQTRLTSSRTPEYWPVWSADGREVAYLRGVTTGPIVRHPVGRPGAADHILVERGGVLFDWSADGRYVTYLRSSAETLADLEVAAVHEGATSHAAAASRFQEGEGRLSPDGKWLAYASDESGRLDVFVQSFPTPDTRRAISLAGGMQPAWRADGKELFFLGADGWLMAVAVDARHGFTASAPRRLFATTASTGPVRNSYTVTSDGERFLVNANASQPSPVVVVLNADGVLASSTP